MDVIGERSGSGHDQGATAEVDAIREQSGSGCDQGAAAVR